MNNKYSDKQIEETKEDEQIKKLVQRVKAMGFTKPYNTETYKMLLVKLLGMPTEPAISTLANQEEQGQIKHIKKQEKTQKSNKLGRGKKSEILLKIESLLLTDFFDTEKTMRDIQNKLRDEGYSVDLSKFSPILLFLIKEGRIKRTKNEHKRFVYFKDNKEEGENEK